MRKKAYFSENQWVEAIDEKGKRYLLKLKKGKEFCLHLGTVKHEKIIGRPYGISLKTSLGKKLIFFPTTLKTYVLKMKRGAQIIYPKDIAQILLLADIRKKMKVLEGGTGSGALTIFLLNALGERGKLISYESRKDFFKIAKENIKEIFGKIPPNLILKNKDLKEGVSEKNFERIILDLPEPWKIIPHIKNSLKPGGILICYNPTILQMKKTIEVLKREGFYFEELSEILKRDWKSEKLSLRPKDRMIAHTGFILVARKMKI